ncbi:PREDICTED: secretogranin-1 isoform X2 [Cyprinodon variegatus]|uniref:secretogranin-1 isoform X2 n=1 Tax=Cyprinodon variegatus TaxID=28743 RepID=UPI000742784B|nr:PREDICTED: secretogranin-1 isoform X2 [Cyprinodon variegatus]
MKPILIVVLALLAETVALPVGKERQREDVVARCLVEVLSKALSKPDVRLDQQCKDILQAGAKYAPVNKKTSEGFVTQEDNSHAGEPTAKTPDVKDIEELLKSVEEKRETPEDEQDQESWTLSEKRDGNKDDEIREKRSGWRPGRFHQRKGKRGEDDYDRSQESWAGLERRAEDGEDDEESEEREKRNWRPGRFHQRKHKRDEEDGREPEEYWDVEKRQDDEERDKHMWKPTSHYHHKIMLQKRRDEPSEGEGYEDRSQESWDIDKRNWRPGRVHQRKHKRDEELSEEAREDPEEERSQEYWDFDTRREKRNWRPGRVNQRRHKRDEELSEEAREEPEEERSQEYWDFDTGREKRNWRPGRVHQRRHKRDELSEEAREEPDEERSQEYWDFDTGIDKRNWRPGRYHQRKHKRNEELRQDSREGPEEERSQEYWDFDKREDEDREIEKMKPTHQYHSKGSVQKQESTEEEMEQRGDSEENTADEKDRDEALRYLLEKRNPWINRGYYHPAWFKRNSDEPAATSTKMDELTKLLNFKLNQLANHPTKEEEKELENLAAMDMELQKIAAKLHDKTS